MHNTHRRYVAPSLLLLALASLLVAPAGAQNPQYKVTVMPPGGPAPRTADGRVDLSGVWWPNGTGRPHIENTFEPGDRFAVDPMALRQFDPKVTPEERPSFQPSALERMKTLTATQSEARKLSVNCMPRGLPAIWLSNTYAIQFVQSRGQIVQLIEVLNNFRVIPIDGRPHPKYPEPLFHGNPSAKWEGDTLVIESIGFDERTFVTNNGQWFHSDALKVTERITRPSMNHLIVQITVDDPKVLTKPWTSAPRRWTLTTDEVKEFYCTDNPDLEEFQKIIETETRGR